MFYPSCSLSLSLLTSYTYFLNINNKLKFIETKLNKITVVILTKITYTQLTHKYVKKNNHVSCLDTLSRPAPAILSTLSCSLCNLLLPFRRYRILVTGRLIALRNSFLDQPYTNALRMPCRGDTKACIV